MGILLPLQLLEENPHVGVYTSQVKYPGEIMLRDMVMSITCSDSLPMFILLYELDTRYCILILL